MAYIPGLRQKNLHVCGADNAWQRVWPNGFKTPPKSTVNERSECEINRLTPMSAWVVQTIPCRQKSGNRNCAKRC